MLTASFSELQGKAHACLNVAYSRTFGSRFGSAPNFRCQDVGTLHVLLLLRFHSSASSMPWKEEHGFRLYDSLSESIKPVSSAMNPTKKGLAWYTCGPTTYAPAHLGHARTYVCLDIVRRVLENWHSRNKSQQQQPPPLFVMNITDVDDKILAASKQSGEPPLELARRFEQDFWKDLDALNCIRPHVVTRVSEHVLSDIIPYIQKLFDLGMAYETEDAVYFDLKSFDERLGTVTKYGKLAPSSNSAHFFTLANPDSAESLHTRSVPKKDPRDFALWKKRKQGEDLYWNSPWGDGRPGWHIECSAMIEAVSIAFQQTHQFRIHAGGIDLKFPHHSNEIAQSEAYRADKWDQLCENEWIPHWVHTGHLHIDGMKMSKSLKNFITIQELLQNEDASLLTSPADDFRLWCLGLSGSYRGLATFSMERIHEARAVREKIIKFLIRGSEWVKSSRGFMPKKWTSTEHKLFSVANESFAKAQAALFNDLDGKSFIEQLTVVSEMGNSYLNAAPSGPTEPIEHCMAMLRESLMLVGFSEKTYGIAIKKDSSESKHAIMGGEEALIEEFVKFRSELRSVALADIRMGGSTPLASEILRLCDKARDQMFQPIGLQLVDGDEGSKTWHYCLPSSRKSSTTAAETPVSKSMPLVEIPLKDFFKVGQYENMFLEFDEEGFPIKHSDGTNISNRLMKKLLSKREKHAKRLSSVSDNSHE